MGKRTGWWNEEMKYKDIVTLSDKCKYIVVETLEFEDKKYFYLIDID